MLERSKLDGWYEGKFPRYDLSSNAISPNKNCKELFAQGSFKSDIFDYCKQYGDTQGDQSLILTLSKIYNCNPSNVLITNGASEALYIVLQIFANQSCDILYQLPYYHDLESLILQSGNFPKCFNLVHTGNSFNFSFEKMRSQVTNNTKLMIMNFPNNPTGTIIQDDEYNDIISFARKNNIIALFDDVAADINYMFKQGYIERNINRILDSTICISSMSKSFGLAGLRIGWIIADSKLIQKCQIIKEILSVSCSPFSQFMANEILQYKDIILQKHISQVRNNLDYLLSQKNRWEKYFSLTIPNGGACCFIKNKLPIDVDQFCSDLYTLKSVLVTPGSIFGYNKYMRLGLGLEKDEFKIALDILIDFFDKHPMT